MRGGHSGGCGPATFSPDHQFFATSGDDFTIKIWRADGYLERTIHAPERVWVSGVRWSPVAPRLVTFGWESVLRLGNPETAEQHCG